MQRGRCRHCGARIAPFHVAIELGAIAVAVWVLCAETNPDRVWVDCMLGWILLSLACIDWRWMLLPDVLTLPLLVAGLVFMLLIKSDRVALHAAAAAVGYIGFRGIAWLYWLARGRDGAALRILYRSGVLGPLAAWRRDGVARVVPGAVSLLMMLPFAEFAPRTCAGEPGAICRVRSVVGVMTHEVRRRDPYARVRPRWIAAYPSLTPNVVLCGVASQTLRCDASRGDDVPLRYSVRHEFRVGLCPTDTS